MRRATHLQISYRPGEGVLAEPPLLVEELARLPVGRGEEEPVVEALLELLGKKSKEI